LSSGLEVRSSETGSWRLEVGSWKLEINNFVSRETFMEEVRNCAICEGDNFVHLFQCKDYLLTNEIFSISQCKKCDFRFTNPRPDNGELIKYYESVNYISHSEKPENFIDKIYYSVRKIALNSKYKLVVSEKRRAKSEEQLSSILDIGCGTGEFISLFKANNWKVYGIEPNRSAREQAIKKKGLEVFEESFLDKFSDKQFDVITMWHVLEHVSDLNGQLKSIKRILKDDGLMIIAVPNSDSFDAQLYRQYWAAFDVPRHLYHFTKKSVNELLTKNDFELLKVLPMKFDAFYISLLSEKYKIGKNNYISAFFNGIRSNIKAKKNSNYSSLTFLFKKKN
jgi:2-polyprenyl-3-methyl-5-hydroxy-6-metoxy-1,4-benzoquinol methylase